MGLTRPRAYQIFDIDYKQSVRVVTVSNVTLGGGAPSQVDGVSLSLNDRVLVTAQSTGSQNGLYYVTTVGTGSNGTWARSVDGNETGEIDAGMIVMVTEGTTYADTQWKLTTNDPIVIGSTALTFVQNYSANSISAGTSNVVVNSNANVTISAAGTADVLTVTSTGANVAGYANITGNIDTVGAININSSSGMYNVLNITGTALAPYGSSQTWKFFTQNAVPGGPGSWILFPDSSTQTTAYPGSSSTLSLSGNITGGNLISNAAVVATGNITGGNLAVGTGNITGGNVTGFANVNATTHTGTTISVTGNVTSGNLVTSGLASVTGNVTGGNLVTSGQISATGTITSNGATNSTAFAVGNSAVSNVALGFFPTAGTKGDYAIRDYSTVFSNMYFDVCIGGSANGAFQFRSSNGYSQFANINSVGINTPLAVTATGTVSGSELSSTNSQVNEGGQINLALPSSGSTLVDGVIIDVYQNKLRFFERGGTNRGAYMDLTAAGAGVGTNLLASGGGGTPGGSNTYVQFNDGGTFGGNAQFTYDKVTNTLTAGIIWATNNANGTNFKVGDDAWIGDINLADTMRVMGQQNAANAYIVFGNTDGTALGRAGSGPLTYGGAFTATGNITGGNLSGTSISGTLTTAAQTNITSVGTLGSLAVTGNITAGNLTGATLVSATNLTGTLTTAAQTNITSLGTLGSLAVTGNTTSGNFVGTLNGSGANVTSISATNISSGTLAQARLANSAVTLGSTALTLGSTVTTVAGLTSVTSTTFVGALTGAATTAGTVTTAAQPNITSTGTLSSLSVTGNITSSTGHVGTIYTNSIINTGANATGNIGSSTLYFNTAFVKATSAQYADLAEMYVADADYSPGTVVEFGGTYEITQTTTACSTAVAGIISTNPSYLMNSCQVGEYVLPVALTGRVPCQVLGPVKKGDVLISSNVPGVAQRIGANWQPGCTVGKAMEDISESVVKVIEVAVGRL